MRPDRKGHAQWYLMPGKRGQVSGCIVLDKAPPVGTNLWWGGLIHEFVDVPNNDIDRISVQVGISYTQTITHNSYGRFS